MYGQIFLYVLALICMSVAQEELLRNPDFEEAFDGQNNWWCNSCQLEHSNDSLSGQFSGKITARTANWAGVSQKVDLKSNGKYYFNARVKYLNQLPGSLYHQMDLYLDINRANTTERLVFGTLPHMELALGWVEHGADVAMGPEEITSVIVSFQVDGPGVNYLVDKASFKEIIPNPNWKEEANARIEQIRKADITLDVTISSSYNPADIKLEVTLKRHAFPFGSAVQASWIVRNDTLGRKYQDFFYNNFEYAVLENALKWTNMEWDEGIIDFETPGKAIDALEQNGTPIRGHCVYWEKTMLLPDWLWFKNATQIRYQISRRAQYAVEAYKGRLAHWDVNNEDLHGEFFKTMTRDTNIYNFMLEEVHKHDTNCSLFLNDYNIMNAGLVTQAFLNQANHIKASNVPLHGLGVQCHLNQDLNVDADLFQKRIDTVSRAGLPIWVTEMDYSHTDRNARAEGYENLLRFYYSQPSVEGLLIWGFWDGALFKPDAAIVEGNNFTLNEAGRRWQKLLREEWNTTASLYPSTASESFSIRGFQGNYNINVKHQNNVIKTIGFNVANKAESHRVKVEV